MNRMLFSAALAVVVAAAPLTGYGAEKDAISHRGKAFRALAPQIGRELGL